MLKSGSEATAVLYVSLSMVIGVAAVFAGQWAVNYMK